MNASVNTGKAAEPTYTDLQITPLTFPEGNLGGGGKKTRLYSTLKETFLILHYLSTRINI